MKFNIRFKILAGFAICQVLVLVLGAYTLYRISALDDQAKMIGDNYLPAVYHLGALRAKYNRLRATQYIFFSQEGAGEGFEKTVKSNEKIFAELTEVNEKLQPLFISDEELTTYQSYREVYDRYVAQHGELVQMLRESRLDDARSFFMGPMLDQYNLGVSAGVKLTNLKFDRGNHAVQMSHDEYRMTRWLILGAIAGTILVGLISGWWISNRISRPIVTVVEAARDLVTNHLPQLTSAAEEIAAGNLTRQVSLQLSEIKIKSNDEVGLLVESWNKLSADLSKMGGAFRRMTEGLRETVKTITGGAENINRAAEMVSGASGLSRSNSQVLASSTNQVSATIREMAASLNQVAGHTRQQSEAAVQTSEAVTQMQASLVSIAESTHHLASLTEMANKAAVGGKDAIEASNREVAKVGASINEVNHTINTLGEKAESIWKIVETIDEIAEQTNLLALNAAIESARAGEHGLGFAVVADEVRKLAERSAHSTHEISELLDHIRREARLAVEQMTRSTKVVEDYMQEKRVSDALLEVTTAIDQIVTATRHIEQATKDQTCGADEISHAMSSLNILTKEVSAATSEQTVGASQIVLAMDNLADVVQQSSNMSGSLESSAIELSEQVERLQATMRRFKTGSVSTPAAAHSKKAAEVRV